MTTETTCWTIIEAAAAGNEKDRDVFARRFMPVVHAYLKARWHQTRFADEVDDVAQDVFVECFRSGGPLERADRQRPGGFHAFLYAVVRNIALRTERKQAKYTASQKAGGSGVAEFQADETSLSRVFDRAWAAGLLEEAANRQAAIAIQKGDEALKRVELLRLRFQEGLPIRQIADQWQIDAKIVHREYSKARNEFSQALRMVVSVHYNTASKAEIDRQCQGLLHVLR